MANHSKVYHSYDADPRRRLSAHYQQQPQPKVYGNPNSVAPNHPHPLPRRPRPSPSGTHPGRRYLLAGGSMLALAALVLPPSLESGTSSSSTRSGDVCIKQMDQQSLMSRDELEAVLDLPIPAPREQVQAIVKQPHCVLEMTPGKAGGQVEREAYPLEFDPQTWFVLLYQDGNYAGYDFSFR